MLHAMSIAPIQDAATVLLLRAGDPFEIFMVRRARKAAFMADAMVFPGGRVDPTDSKAALHALCALDRAEAGRQLGIDDQERALAFLVAALRETFEEAGVLLARTADGSLIDFEDPAQASHFEAYREQLNCGACSLLEIARAEALTLAVDLLIHHAHWITPPIESRRFDTHFLITRAPAGQNPLHDDIETNASAWLSPRAALEGYAKGTLQLAPPTLRILMELDRLPTIEAALQARLENPPIPYQPQPQHVDGELHLLLPGDPDFEPPGDARNRIILRDGIWVSEGRGC